MSKNGIRGLISVQGQRDQIIRTLRKLKTSGGRAKEGLFIVEGLELCQRVISYGGTLEALICTEGLIETPRGESLRSMDDIQCPVYVTTHGLIGKCLESKPTPQCLGLVRRVLKDWEELLQSPHSLWLGVDHGENADNLGMLLRSAEAANVDGVLLGGQTVDPFGRRVVRASRGAVFSLSMCIERDLASAVIRAKQLGVQIITTSANVEKSYCEVDYTRPTLLIVGNEHRGVSEAVLKHSEMCVQIPMLGHINSLNISVAASLMMFEAQRQRGWSR